MSSEKKNNNERRGFFAPILLIAIGLIFLGYNLGIIPDDGWQMAWRLWPVLLIIAGLNDLVRREGIAWPILLIGAGVFFLLNNFGPRVWISWSQIFQLWPILLIAAGIDLVFKGDSIWFTIAGVVLTLVLIGGSVWIVRDGFQVAAEYTDIREIFSDEVDQMELHFSLGVGELILGSESPDNTLVSGSITPGKHIDQISTEGKTISYQLENKEPGFYPHTARWELNLTDELSADLIVDNSAGEVILSLEEMDLASLDLNQGVGRLVVQLPEMMSDHILIKQAVGMILVQIPKNVHVAIDAQNGLSKVDFPTDFELEDGYYVSSGASQSNAQMMIVVEQAMGLIHFRYTD